MPDHDTVAAASADDATPRTCEYTKDMAASSGGDTDDAIVSPRRTNGDCTSTYMKLSATHTVACAAHIHTNMINRTQRLDPEGETCA
jgi:hypothetical protein